MGLASTFSVEASAFPESASFKSNSSWAASSFSLLVPKIRRMSRSTFSLSNLISSRLPLIVGLETLDLSLFLSDEFLEPNYL
jgi:hypothetical protein